MYRAAHKMRLEKILAGPLKFYGLKPLRRRTLRDQERWQSGRMYLTRNQAYVSAYRGFESHPLRQTQNPK